MVGVDQPSSRCYPGAVGASGNDRYIHLKHARHRIPHYCGYRACSNVWYTCLGPCRPVVTQRIRAIFHLLRFQPARMLPKSTSCVSTRRSTEDSLAGVLVCARDSRARLRSHPPNCPPIFLSRRLVRPATPSTPGGV
jgi:hypothetical protein